MALKHSRFGPYELRGELGRGAMARVWRAWDPHLQREVAIKEPLIEPGMTREQYEQTGRRFVAEGRAAARLNHPNIVQVYAADVYDGRPAIVMELIDGMSLSNMMRSARPSPQQAVSILDQLLDAVGYAHSKGIVHRDIKPDNIFVTRDGRVKLADFGIARVDTATTRATVAGSVLGTPGYMSPEQATGKPADARSDLFSVGVVAYELLSGRNPFGLGDGSDATALLYRIVHIEPAELPRSVSEGLSHDIRPVVMAALSKDPGARPQTASAFRAMLDGSQPAPASTAARSSRTRSGSSSSWLPYAAVFGVAGAVLLGLLASASSGSGGGGGAAASVSSETAVQESSNQVSPEESNSGADSEDTANSSEDAISAEGADTAVRSAIEVPSQMPDSSQIFTSTNVALPDFVYVSSSSSLNSDSLGFLNSAVSVLDGKLDTGWAVRGDSGNGAGEWIEISSEQAQAISGIEILSGCILDSSNDLYYDFSRPRSISISFYNSETDQRWDALESINLVDEPRRLQDISFSPPDGTPLEATAIRITIDSVFEGSRDPACVIGEIKVY